MPTDQHITEPVETLAATIAAMDDGQLGLLSNSDNAIIHRISTDRFLTYPGRKTTDGVTFTNLPQYGSTCHFGGATDYTEIEADGTVKFNNDATVWEDLRIVPGAFQFSGSSDPTLSTWQPGGSGPTFQVYEFTNNDQVFFSCEMPHNYLEGSDVYPHVHWSPRARGTAENGNTVAWKLDYSWANIDAAFAAGSTFDMTSTCSGVNERHEISPDTALSGTGKTISSMLLCRLYRDTGDTWATNTAGNLPVLIEFDIHYQIDTVGSRARLTK